MCYFFRIFAVMEQVNLYGRIVNGKLEVPNKEGLSDWIKYLEEGDDIVIKFNRSKDYKTVRQLRLVYKLFRELSAKLGYSVSEIKGLMKIEQGLCAESTIEGKQISFCKSIGEMTKKELSTFIENVDIWAFQRLGLKLLSNEDIHFLNDTKIT